MAGQIISPAYDSGIELLIYSFVFPVNIDKNLEQPVIDRHVFRIGPIFSLVFHKLRDIVKGYHFQTYRGHEGGAPGVGLDGVHDLADSQVQGVGQDAAPDVGIGPAADQAYSIQFSFQKFFHRSHQPLGVQGHPFQERRG